MCYNLVAWELLEPSYITALNMGREVDENEEEVEEIEEPEKQTSERQSVHAGSKPPTRQDGYNPRSSVAR